MHQPSRPMISFALALILASCAPAPATPAGVAPAITSAPAATPTLPTVSGATSTPYPAATPVGLVLPSGCTYIGPPIGGADSRTWYVDCHTSSSAGAQGPLTAAFVQQGWTPCGTGPLRNLWTKGTTLLTVTESPGGDTQIAQTTRAPGQCP